MTIAIPEKQYFKIGEVSEILDVEPYVLRYWESEFKILKPTRTRARQRLYHKKDWNSCLKSNISCTMKNLPSPVPRSAFRR